MPGYFYPRSPCGERRTVHETALRFFDFYPRSPCGERLFKNHIFFCHSLFLSTLSLRRATSGDRNLASHCRFLSTLSLRRATAEHHANSQQEKFLSTLSLRRATMIHQKKKTQPGFLSTLSLRRATIIFPPVDTSSFISIHALLAESDPGCVFFWCIIISIHALLAESDPANWFDLWGWKDYFYPRSPCGERLCCYKR